MAHRESDKTDRREIGSLDQMVGYERAKRKWILGIK